MVRDNLRIRKLYANSISGFQGMPYPTNVEVARSLEAIVRKKGAIPATIGIIKGRAKIGLKPHELEILGNGEGPVVKVSRRDLAPVIALGRDGGTTISGTMILAALAGIKVSIDLAPIFSLLKQNKVFATGGLGGVHRGGETCEPRVSSPDKQSAYM
jgi:pseudouridine-5'-phosphate glycosidase/pseudouridine kinase